MNRSSAEENIEEKGKITNMISRAVDYISQCYMEDIRIGDLAKACHISETHFRRVFTSYMHMSPLEYINKVRIQTACEILKKRMSLSQILPTNVALQPIPHLTGTSAS